MTNAVSVSLIGNMGSRLLTGVFIDRFGYKSVAIVYTLISITFGATFELVARKEFFYIFWLFIAQVLFAANIVSASVVSLRIFGPETGTQVFPFVQGAISISNMILTFSVVTFQEDLGYQGMLNMMAVASTLSLVFIVLLRDVRMAYEVDLNRADKIS
jgi:MFS family permease